MKETQPSFSRSSWQTPPTIVIIWSILLLSLFLLGSSFYLFLGKYGLVETEFCIYITGYTILFSVLCRYVLYPYYIYYLRPQFVIIFQQDKIQNDNQNQSPNQEIGQQEKNQHHQQDQQHHEQTLIANIHNEMFPSHYPRHHDQEQPSSTIIHPSGTTNN